MVILLQQYIERYYSGRRKEALKIANILIETVCHLPNAQKKMLVSAIHQKQIAYLIKTSTQDNLVLLQMQKKCAALLNQTTPLPSELKIFLDYFFYNHQLDTTITLPISLDLFKENNPYATLWLATNLNYVTNPKLPEAIQDEIRALFGNLEHLDLPEFKDYLLNKIIISNNELSSLARYLIIIKEMQFFMHLLHELPLGLAFDPAFVKQHGFPKAKELTMKRFEALREMISQEDLTACFEDRLSEIEKNLHVYCSSPSKNKHAN